jgi:hypothetical protein
MGTQWPQTASLPSQQGLLPLVAGLLDLGQVVQKGGVMNVMAIAGIVFTCVFGGALLGMFLRAVLPEHHLSPESKDLIKLGMGLVGTMAALVLGLLIASAKSSYDRLNDDLTQLSVKLILLDRIMAHYGPEAMEARDLLRRSVVRALDRTWPENSSRSRRLEPVAGFGDLYDKIHELSPQNDAQRLRQGQALQISTDLAQTRWLLVEQSVSSLPMPFVVLLTFWIMVIFVSFGLFAPSNITVVATLFICALSVSGAIFLILELDQPFVGLIQISNAPLRNALAHLDQ